MAAQNNPTAGIYIITYLGEKNLKNCLRSVTLTDYSPLKLHVIVNGYVKGETERMLEYLKSFPQIDIIQIEKNHGLCIGYNTGLKNAKEDMIVFLNDDVRVEPDWLGKLIKPLIEGKSTALPCRK